MKNKHCEVRVSCSDCRREEGMNRNAKECKGMQRNAMYLFCYVLVLNVEAWNEVEFQVEDTQRDRH